MRKVYESPEAEVVSFTAMEQLALLPTRGNESNETNVDKGPGVSGGVTGRDEW